jgi:hypothetical protein
MVSPQHWDSGHQVVTTSQMTSAVAAMAADRLRAGHGGRLDARVRMTPAAPQRQEKARIRRIRGLRQEALSRLASLLLSP